MALPWGRVCVPARARGDFRGIGGRPKKGKDVKNRIPTKREAELLNWLHVNGAERSSSMAKKMGEDSGVISSYMVQMFKNTNWLNRILTIGVKPEKRQKYFVYEISKDGVFALSAFRISAKARK